MKPLRLGHKLETHMGPTILTKGSEAPKGPAAMSEEYEGNIVICNIFTRCFTVLVALQCDALYCCQGQRRMRVMWLAEAVRCVCRRFKDDDNAYTGQSTASCPGHMYV